MGRGRIALNRTYGVDGNITSKECRGCNRQLPIDCFCKAPKSRSCIDGHNHQCRECTSKRWLRNTDDKRRVQYLIQRIRSKCSKQNIPFNITVDDIIIPSNCPVLGIPLKFGSSKRTGKGVVVEYNSPSVDRIVPERGYVKGNIVVVSYRANLIKTNASLEEIQKVAEFYKQFAVDSNE